MAIKVYVSDRKNLAVSWERKSEIAGKSLNSNVIFVDGVFSTDDEATQKFIEGLPTFKDGAISLRTLKDEIAEAEAKVRSLRAVADKAVAAVRDAEDAVKALHPAKSKELVKA